MSAIPPAFGVGDATSYEAATWESNVAATPATPVILSMDSRKWLSVMSETGATG
jgi:hypothetical protein